MVLEYSGYLKIEVNRSLLILYIFKKERAHPNKDEDELENN